MRRPASRHRGFSLIELLVTIAILGIVTTLAVGGYRQYLRRAGRVDATSALLRLASSEEKFYAQKGEYADSADLVGAPPDGLGIAGTERGYYTLAVEAAAGGLAVGYTATATVDPASSQADDADCWVFGINERGLRTAATQGGTLGTAAVDSCWR